MNEGLQEELGPQTGGITMKQLEQCAGFDPRYFHRSVSFEGIDREEQLERLAAYTTAKKSEEIKPVEPQPVYQSGNLFSYRDLDGSLF